MLSRFVSRCHGSERFLSNRVQFRLLAQSNSGVIGTQANSNAQLGKGESNSALRNFAKKHNFGAQDAKVNTKPKLSKPAVKTEVEPNTAMMMSATNDPKVEAIRAKLRMAQASHRPYDIEAVMREVRTDATKLTAIELSTGFEGCLAVSNIELSTWILNHMKNLRHIIPADYIRRVAQKSTTPEQMSNIVKLVMDLVDTQGVNKQGKEEYLNQLISVLSKVGVNNPGAYSDMLKSTYTVYLQLRNQHKLNVKLAKETYGDMAVYYVSVGDADKCLEIFQDMNRANVEPDVRLCERVLDTAISHCETKVIRVIATWYLEVFNVPLQIGLSRRILEIAKKENDGQLAILGFQLLTKTSITPDRMDYYNLVHALIQSNDIVSAVEALQDMESRKVSLIPSLSELRSPNSSRKILYGRNNAFVLYESVKEELQEIFVRNSNRSKGKGNVANTAAAISADEAEEGNDAEDTEDENDKEAKQKADEIEEIKRQYELLEDFYYALIDQVEKGQSVPRVVVDAILEAMGSFTVYGEKNRASHLGRVRTIFNQYPTSFKLDHDITSYVALIQAARRHCSFNDMMTIFQEMEQFVQTAKTSNSPSSMSQQRQFFEKEALSVAYSKLFHFLLTRRMMRNFNDIWEHMRTQHDIYPDSQCLTRLTINFAQRGQVKERDMLLKTLNEVLKDSLNPAKSDNFKEYPAIPKSLMFYIQELGRKNAQNGESNKSNQSQREPHRKNAGEVEEYLSEKKSI